MSSRPSMPHWRQTDLVRILIGETISEIGSQVGSLALPFAAVSLEAGAVDLILNPALNDFVRLQQSGTYQTLPNPLSGSYYALVPNVTVPPLDNKQVRQAGACAPQARGFDNNSSTGE